MSNSDLKKNLNTLDVLSVAFGAMIGWGWVVSSGQWITSGGVLGTVIGFLIGGLMIYFVGLAYAELTTAMPKSGGVQNFCYAAFGPVGAFVSTWALILSYVGVVCFEAVSFPTIIQYIFPGFLKGYLYTVKGFDIYASWLVVAIITAAIIVYINIKGTKKAAKLQNVLNGNQMVTSMQGTGLVTADAMAIAFNSHTMAKVLILGGLCGIITSWNSFLIGGSRVMFAMAKSRMIPSSFAKLHPVYKTPIVALLLLGLTSIIAPFFGRVMLVWIVDAANFACCLAYCIVSLSFVVLRKKKANLKRPYRVRHASWVGIMAVLMSGFMAAMYLIPGSACTLVWQEMVIVVGWTLLGIFLGIRGKRLYKDSFASGMDI